MNSIKHVLLIAGVVFMSATASLAHGVDLNAIIQARTSGGSSATYSEANLPRGAQVTSIQIVAKYSTGEPMSGAQVTVLAPDDRSTPWRTGNCDSQGRYTFTPDLSKRGNWIVRVQTADHSNIITIPVL